MSPRQDTRHSAPLHSEAAAPVERQNSGHVPVFPRRAIQRELMRYIAGYHAAHDGISPTFEECARALGLHGKSAISKHLGDLERRNRIRRLHCRARAIEVLAPITILRLADGTPLHAVPLPAMTNHHAEQHQT